MSSTSTKYFCYLNDTNRTSYTSGYGSLSTQLSNILSNILANFDVKTLTNNTKLIDLADTTSLDLNSNSVVKLLCTNYNNAYNNFLTIPDPNDPNKPINLCCPNGTSVATQSQDINGNITVTCACGSGTLPYFDNTTGSLMCNAGYGCAGSSIETKSSGSNTVPGYGTNLVCDCLNTDSNWGMKSKKCYNTSSNVQTPTTNAGSSLTDLRSKYITSSTPIGAVTMVGTTPYANFTDNTGCYIDAAQTRQPTLCSSKRCSTSTKNCCSGAVTGDCPAAS